MKKLLSALLAFALCASLFAGVGFTAAAESDLDRYVNATGGSIAFDNDAEYPWVYDTISIGKYGASAGNVGVDSSSSTISATITFEEGQGIYFTWRASSQQKWDYLAFSIDGVEKARISGDFGPENRVFAVEAGEHVVSWTYVKDEAYSLYNDKGYIDEVHVGSYNASATDISAALNPAGDLTFENDAAEPWTAQNGFAASGNAGKSASGSAVTLRASLEESKVLCFNWGVSSEKNHDTLAFEVNGEEIAAISGEVAYPTAYTYTAPAAGEYVFRWIYAKDTLGSFGSDAGYLGDVRVTDYVATTSIMTVKNTSVAVGKTLKLTFATKPTGATSRAVTWESDNEAVATVDASGIVTGVSAGTANVTVTTVEGGFTSTSVITVTPFAGDYDYYVNTATGNDRNKGNTPNSPFRTMHAAYNAIYNNVPSGGSAKITLSGNAVVSEELRIFDKEINVVAASGATAAISRAGSYTGPLFRVAAGGRLRLGSTDENGGVVRIGGSSADAPCVLVDGGEFILYSGADIYGSNCRVSGAGVYVKSGSFTMLGGSITGQYSGRYGGGIYAEGGSVIISGGSVSGNSAGIYGGGAYIATDVEYSIDESVFSGNTAGEDFDEICYGEPPAAPEIIGVEDGAEYSLDEYPEGVSAVWSGDSATATLNGEPYEEDSKITEPGEYVLTVTDGYSVVTVCFRVWQPSHEAFWVEAFLSDNAAGETGWVSFDMNGNEEPVRYAVPEKPVAAAVYLAGKVYGYSEDGYFFTADLDAELEEGALRYSNTVWSDGPVISDYTVLDMTYDYLKRDMAVLLADDDNVRYVAIINRDGTIDHAFPVYDAAEQDETVSPLLMTIACSAEGYYYGISGGERAALWMLTGADEAGAYVSKLFDMECEAYYLQSMAFDLNTNTLYWAQCGLETGSIYRVDIEDEFLGYCGSPLGMDAELTALLFIFDIDTSEEYVTEDGRFTYTYLPEGGIEIAGYNFKNDGGDPLFPLYDEDTFLVEVPAQINGMDVLSIGKYAFRDRSVGEDPVAYMQIGKAVLPETIETIGYGAFRGCASMKEIEFGGQEHEIGDYAFYQCRSLTDVCIPWPTETIGYGAFSECTSLVKATVTGPTENFGDYIFYNVPENFELWGHWPSATYDYAIANNLTFRDIEPYEAPEIVGVNDGDVIILTESPEGVSPAWSGYAATATLDGEPYDEGTPITAPGEHVLTVTDGRSEVSVSFTIKEEYDTPAVSGVEDGGVYSEPVTLTWDVGEATLNGEPVENGAVVSEPGEYTLEVVNGDKATTVAFTVEQPAPPVLRGDMDKDGEITVADALKALRIAAKLVEETGEDIAIGDVDNDGEITVADALKILRVAAKLADQSSLQ